LQQKAVPDLNAKDRGPLAIQSSVAAPVSTQSNSGGHMRALLALGLCCAVVGCDPAQSGAIALAPHPAIRVDSARHAAFGLVARVAKRRGLEAFDPKDREEEDWIECLGKSSLILCGKVNDGEVQFRMWERIRFSPQADSLRHELLDSLRAQFGRPWVRECEWRIAHAPRRSGCPPLARADSA
jgi:hypothetical protein